MIRMISHTFIEKYKGKGTKVNSRGRIRHLITGYTSPVNEVIESDLDYEEVTKRVIEFG